jgi:predicted XRE-type DNA-binding protein
MKMDKRKRARLVAGGWTVGRAKDFLHLSNEEAAYVEMKLALGTALRSTRAARGMSQAEAARTLGSSQSRVAKMEAADASVSLDLLVRSLLKLGEAPGAIAKAIRPRRKTAAA